MPTVVLPDPVVTLVAETCCNCGLVFAMPKSYVDTRRRDRTTFHCPNGHPQHYTGQTEEAKLRDQLTAEKHRREQAEASASHLRSTITSLHAESAHKDRRINGYRGVLARTKKKINAGRCPCCSHQFKDLEQHMRAEHPEWNPERAAEALTQKEADALISQVRKA